MTPRISAIVVAAGSGSRLGYGCAKAWAPLGGRPLLCHALQLLHSMPEVDEIVIVLRAEDVLQYAGAIGERYDFPKVCAVVPGGARRQDSVRHGLASVYSRTQRVLVHDAARPLADAALVRRTLAALDAEGVAGAIPAMPVTDTLKRVDGERIVGTVDRSALVHVQTPQAFAYAPLFDAHMRARDNETDATDDAALLEACGECVVHVRGDAANLKITYAQDLIVAEALLAARTRSAL